jgi:sulfide dehydrogenase cytochrome subunit
MGTLINTTGITDMTKRFAYSIVICSALFTVLQNVQARETASAQLLAQNCAACHGMDGREFNEAMPPLAGMSIEQFIGAMNAFKHGKRQAVIMDRVARGYNDDEIRAMAEYFAAQPSTQYGKQHDE